MSEFKELEIIVEVIKKTKTSLQSEVDSENIAFLRNNLRKSIFFLKEELLDKYSNNISEYIIFPLLAYVDEKILLTQESTGFNLSWGLLQLEYYDRKDGGEYVYEIIDRILSDNIYPNLCYQVIHLIFDNGFLGKFYGNVYNHDFLAYKKKITSHLNSIESKALFTVEDSPKIKPRKKSSGYSNSVKLILPIVLFTISVSLFIF